MKNGEKKKKIVILIIKENVYGWCLMVNIYIYRYIYYIMLAIMENCWGYSLCLVEKKTESKRIEVINIIILMMRVS